MSDEEVNRQLTFSRDEMRAMGYQVVDLLVEHVATLRDRPVTAMADHHLLEARLREPVPEHGRPFDTVLRRLQEDVFSSMMHLGHPRFFAFVPGPSNFVG